MKARSRTVHPLTPFTDNEGQSEKARAKRRWERKRMKKARKKNQ